MAALTSAADRPAGTSCSYTRGLHGAESSGCTLLTRGQGLAAVLAAEPHRMTGSFGRTTQNSFPSGSARTVQDSAPVWPMRARIAPVREESVDLLIAVCGAAGEVKMHAVLDRLGVGDRHMPAGAFPWVPMTISFSRSDRTFQPGAWVQNRARPGRSCSVDDDVVDSDGECRQYARRAGPYAGDPPFCGRRVGHRRSRHAVAPGSCDQPDPSAAREPEPR